MAIDLYDGQIATNPQHAKLLMNSIKQADANTKFAAALDTLKAPGRKIATIGWSYGASQALRATLSAPEPVSATVSYYVRINDNGQRFVGPDAWPNADPGGR